MAKFIVLLMAGACFALAPAVPVVLFVIGIGDTGDCELGGTLRVAAAVRAQPDAAKAKLIEVGDLACPVATRAPARMPRTLLGGIRQTPGGVRQS